MYAVNQAREVAGATRPPGGKMLIEGALYEFVPQKPKHGRLPDDCPIFIYVLVDPRTGDVRYVGATVNIAVRFRSHTHGGDSRYSKRSIWLRELKAAGVHFRMFIVQETTMKTARADEQRWIDHYKGLGVALVNGTPGAPKRSFT